MPGIGFVDRMYAKNRYLFLAYILSTKPIPGMCFAHNHCAGHLILFNIT